MTYSVVIDDKNQTVLESGLSLIEAETELCRTCNEDLDAYITNDN